MSGGSVAISGEKYDIKGQVLSRGRSHDPGNGKANKLKIEDRTAHDWYRFVLSYPPHLVRDYLRKFEIQQHEVVLDPFCGTGTTLVECKKNGIPSIGLEAHPMPHFASSVKLDWNVDADRLLDFAQTIAADAYTILAHDGVSDGYSLMLCESKATYLGEAYLRTLPEEQAKLLLANSISPLPLHKALVVLELLNVHHSSPFYRHALLALAKSLVFYSSNLNFGPEVGVGVIKADAPVIAPWLAVISAMVEDLRSLTLMKATPGKAICTDSRNLSSHIEHGSISAIITSPPYPNEKDYTRTTRLESVLLGFVSSKSELQALKRGLLRSNTRNVYKGDDDDHWIESHAEIQRIANEIEARRISLGKTSGFERMYAKVTRLYFGGMARHLANLRPALRAGAHLAYVVGDQASYLRIMIRTGELLADIAASLGYEVESIDLFRTRLSTATKEQLREEVVVLRWPG